MLSKEVIIGVLDDMKISTYYSMNGTKPGPWKAATTLFDQ